MPATELAETAVYKKSKAALQRRARPAAPGRHRLHPRGAAARRAAVHLGSRPRVARRRHSARGLGRGPRIADLVDGHRGARRRDRNARSRRDRRARARPSAGGDGRCVPEPAGRGARAAARRDVLRRRHGRRADGLRGHHGAPGRHARGRAALPAPLRRTAVADRPGVRRRSRRAPAGRAADQQADRHRPGNDGRGDHATAGREAAAAREGRCRRVRVRALRPRFGARRRHPRPAGRPRDRRRGARLRPAERRGRPARAGRPARGGGRLRLGVGVVSATAGRGSPSTSSPRSSRRA